MVNSMFKKPQLLNKEKDKGITIAELKDYKHAKKAHFMPISKPEANEACKHYPIFFLKENGKDVIPIVLLGIAEGTNLFVNKPGEWEAGRYIPALIRCYPFSVTKNEERFTVVFDAEYEGLNQKEGRTILGDDGEPNEYGQKVIEFVQQVYTDLELTRPTCNAIDSAELFKTISATIEKDKERYQINGLLQVDAQKLNTLDDATLLSLAKSGALNLIYAHLISMSNLNNLARKLK